MVVTTETENKRLWFMPIHNMECLEEALSVLRRIGEFALLSVKEVPRIKNQIRFEIWTEQTIS